MTADATCATCGTELRENAKFCHECGASTIVAADTPEYKQVTVLFADVVQSMDIAAVVSAERLREIMAELVSRGAAAIVTTGGNVTALAAKGATSTIPIVFVAGGDPVGTGLVVSLNRPGGNMTGVSLAIAELAAKRLELLRELMPQVASIAVLGQPRQSRLRRGRARRARPCRSPRRRNPRDLGRGRERFRAGLRRRRVARSGGAAGRQ